MPVFLILWNGQPLEAISPKRGLRQGDPLSSYLFVLYMDKLSYMISAKVTKGNWKGIKSTTHGPFISHLYFVDDLILFFKASNGQCEIIMDTLNTICNLSGQNNNLNKSKLFVSPNISRRQAKELNQYYKIPSTEYLGKYLGVPLLHSRVSKSIFLYYCKNWS